MIDDPVARQYNLFADLLDYPTSALSRQAKACTEWLIEMHPEAAVRLRQFQCSVDESTAERMEEIYTRTFDMQPVSYPYVGYHLFGESYKRGAFMAQLIEGYNNYGFSPGNELPDHVGVILRFFASSAAGRNSDFGQTLLGEGMVPTLEKMAKELNAQPNNPYAAVVSALLLVFTHKTEKEIINV